MTSRRFPAVLTILLLAFSADTWIAQPSPQYRNRNEIAAQRVEEQADNLVRQFRAESSKAALAKYEEALQGWKRLGNTERQLRALTKISVLAGDLGQAEKALAYSEQAVAVARQSGNVLGEAESLLVLARIQSRGGQASTARENSGRALQLSRSIENRPTEAEALFVLGDMYYEGGDLVHASDAFSRAHSIWNDLADLSGKARALLSESYILSNLNEFDQALRNAREAASTFKSLDDKRHATESATQLGNIHVRMGRKQDGLSFYQEARSLLQDSGDSLSEALLYGNIARVLADLGDDNTGLQYFKMALDRYRLLHYRVGEAFALRAIGDFYLHLGDTANALHNYESAIEAFRELSNKRLEAFCLSNLAAVYELVGETEKAVDLLQQALALNTAVSDKRLESSANLSLGHVNEGRRDFNQALQKYQIALQLARKSEDRYAELAAVYGIASCFRKLGRLDEALQQSDIALGAIERMRATVASAGLRASYFASVKQHYDLQIDLLMRLANNSRVPSKAMLGFEVSERSRARSLLESISETRVSIFAGGDPALLAREVSLRTSLDAKSERYTQLLSAVADSKEIANLDAEIRRLSAEYDELVSEIRLRSPQYTDLILPQPLHLSEIQQQIVDNDSLLLEYALGEETSYLWAVSRDDFAYFTLPNRSEIEKRVRAVRKSLASRVALPNEKPADFQARVKAAEEEYPKLAAELSQMLLGPVAERLGNKRLVIVGEGVLQYLPFGALPTPQSAQTGSPVSLVVEHEIVSLPSASTLAVIRREAPMRGTPDRTLAVFADPVFEMRDARVRRPAGSRAAPVATISQTLRGSDALGPKIDFPRLPSTKQEAEAILAMVPESSRMGALGFKATKAAAMNPDLKRYRIVHFATHTVLDDEHPDLSSLVLSLVDERGNPQSGFLRLRDMYNLQLAAELVVLSACDTALGKEVKGEGLMSMVRGFMYSGTPRVLASLWKVDDEATAELMKEFYKHLLEEKMTPAAALRQAQIAQMQKRSRQAPYYWAGFQLQGEWK